MHPSRILVSSVIFLVLKVLLQDTHYAQGHSGIDSVRWVPHVNTSDFDLHLFDYEAPGMENGGRFYIARAYYRDGFIPGKHQYMSNPSWMTFTYNRKELKLNSKFDVLLYPSGVLTWVQVTNSSSLPPHKFPAGKNPISHEDLYVCRVWYDKRHLVLGKVSLLESEKCSYPFYGERTATHYEILVDTRLASPKKSSLECSNNYVSRETEDTYVSHHTACLATSTSAQTFGHILLGVVLGSVISFILMSFLKSRYIRRKMSQRSDSDQQQERAARERIWEVDDDSTT